MRVAVVVLVAAVALLGFVYPAAVWALSRIDTHSAEGSALRDSSGCVVGSSLLGVDPQPAAGEPDPYFHTRVVGSVADGDPGTPGDPAAGLPTNQGPSSEVLAAFVAQRRTQIAEREGVTPAEVPADAVTGSGSGLDPHISPAYAALQVPRVARETGRTEDDVRGLVAQYTAPPQWGFLGAERVSVPELNVALGAAAPDCGS